MVSTYVTAGESGLKVVSISIPSAPVIVGSVDTPGIAFTVTVAEGFAYVADLSGADCKLRSIFQSPLRPTS